jgi:hypothetical protein
MKNLQLSLIKNYIVENDLIIIDHLYKILTLDTSINIKIFSTNNHIPSQSTHYTILPIYEAKYAYDIALVWDLLSLELVLGFPNLQKILYFQLDELPWVGHGYMPYSSWNTFFNNDKITVITDDIIKQDMFRSTWNDKTININKLNLKELYEIL